MSDLIDRDLLLEKMADYVASGFADSVEDFEEYSKIVCQLPGAEKTDTVSLEAYKQVIGERNIAIQQLEELGYEFGEKIEQNTKDLLIADIKKLQLTDQIEVAKELLSNDGWLFYLLWIEGKINEREKRHDRTKKG